MTKVTASVLQARAARAQAKMQELDLDGLLLYKPQNTIYYSGLSQNDSACLCVIMPREGEAELVTLWTDVKYMAARTPLKITGFAMAKENQHDGVARVVRKLGLHHGRLGIEKDWITLGQFEFLTRALPNAQFPEATEVHLYTWIDELRMTKGPEEIDLLRKAAVVADEAMEAAVKAVAPGVCGYDIAAEAEYVMRKHGSGMWVGGHPTIVASGSDLHLSHPFASAAAIKAHDLVTIDLGAVIEGYHSDLCRTLAVGDVSEEQERQTLAVLAAQSAGIASMRAGATLHEIDQATRAGLGEYGKYQYSPGLVGHGCGLANGAHAFDAPFIAMNDHRQVEEGMVLAIFEIPPFTATVGAPRFEDMILITDGEPELLTRYARELIRVC